MQSQTIMQIVTNRMNSTRFHSLHGYNTHIPYFTFSVFDSDSLRRAAAGSGGGGGACCLLCYGRHCPSCPALDQFRNSNRTSRSRRRSPNHSNSSDPSLIRLRRRLLMCCGYGHQGLDWAQKSCYCPYPNDAHRLLRHRRRRLDVPIEKWWDDSSLSTRCAGA
jgi:hypothetical protein